MVDEAIKEFEKDYLQYKFNTESFTNGYVQNYYFNPITIKAVVQPMTEDELRNVPEGQNTLEWLTIWSRSSFVNKDIIKYQNKNYTIQRVEYWDETPYYKGAMVRVEDQI